MASTSNRNPYTYEQLPISRAPDGTEEPGNFIRLLQFTSSKSNILSVSLQPHMLTESLTFSALSYEWGQRSEREILLIDGKTLEIPRSLYLFLQSLRSTQTGSSTLYFADAISINQADLPERAAQVQLMGQVYSLAIQVHVWLGSPRASLPLLFRFCRTLKRSASEILLRSHFDAVFGSDNEAAFQEAVQALSTCSYWNRLWVIQEILLARELVVHCGDSAVGWHALFEGCHRVLRGDIWRSQAANTPASSFGGAEAIAMAIPGEFDQTRYVSLYLQTSSSASGQGVMPESKESPMAGRSTKRRSLAIHNHTVSTRSRRLFTLKQALSQHGLAECSDRHDRVYGLLGLVLRGNERGYFEADYGESLYTLFERVMRQCGEEELRGDAVAFCRHLRVVLGLGFADGVDGIDDHHRREKTEHNMEKVELWTSFANKASLKYSIVVRFAGRLEKMVQPAPTPKVQENSYDDGYHSQSQSQSRLKESSKLETWVDSETGAHWSILSAAHAKKGDLIYSIDDSCCAAIFAKAKAIPQTPARGKRKRTPTSPPVFVGRAIGVAPQSTDSYLASPDSSPMIINFLHAQSTYHFASKLINERPLLERAGAPWESQVPLSELWALTCDLPGTRIPNQSIAGGILSTESSTISQGRKAAAVRKKARFGFQWTKPVRNSQNSQNTQ